MEKVYCANCRHLINMGDTFNGQVYMEYLCKHPCNLNYSGNWLKDGIDFIAMPNELNASNDCVNFEAITQEIPTQEA